jgi:hypothetical protein
MTRSDSAERYLRLARHRSISRTLLTSGLLTIITCVTHLVHSFRKTSTPLTTPVVRVVGVGISATPLSLTGLTGGCRVRISDSLLRGSSQPYISTPSRWLRHSRRSSSRRTRLPSSLPWETRISTKPILTVGVWLRHSIHWL